MTKAELFHCLIAFTDEVKILIEAEGDTQRHIGNVVYKLVDREGVVVLKATKE